MKTEYTKIDSNWIKVITEKEALTNKESNIYYLNWVIDSKDYSNWRRAKDEDIELKDIFVLDIDMRNAIQEDGEIISNEDIKNEWLQLIKSLESLDEYFNEWHKIIFTWNWLHIIYKWTPTKFTKEQYSMWVNRIYKQWDKFVWVKYWKCDFACKNIARILRLPWSINQKNWALVEIIAEQKKESRLFNMIKAFAEKEQEEINIEELKRKKEIEDNLKHYGDKWNEFYQEINLIPAYQIAQILIPEFPLNRNWKNFNNKKQWLTWYFYNKSTNTIVNGWSRHFNFWWSESCFNNFSLVKHFKGWSDREVFLFFKQLLWK